MYPSTQYVAQFRAQQKDGVQQPTYKFGIPDTLFKEGLARMVDHRIAMEYAMDKLAGVDLEMVSISANKFNGGH